MIKLRTGDLFASDAPAVGHGCNCVGVMGAGIAKQIRNRFPDSYLAYRQACADGTLAPGGAQVLAAESPDGPMLVNLATQDRPGPRARLDWVRSSLLAAIPELRDLGVNRLAIPRIGCGIGGLDFSDVLPVVEEVGRAFPGFDIEIWSLPERPPGRFDR